MATPVASAHNLKKIVGTPARCPWNTRRDKKGYGIFAGTPAGHPGDTRPSRGFLEILCDFFLCEFSAPQLLPTDS